MTDNYIERILKARVYDVAIESPLDAAPRLSRRIGNTVLLKREDLQPVFSFKLRGSHNKIAHLSESVARRGVICASGTLGQIIPPSLILILLADIMNESVGTLFAAAMIPGLMLAGIYVLYLLGLGIFRPHMVPPVPKEERDLLSRGELAGKLLRVVLPPLVLPLLVLSDPPPQPATIAAIARTAISAAASLRLCKGFLLE